MSWVVRIFAYFLLLAFAERIEPFSSAPFGINNFRESYIMTMSSSEKQRSDSRSKEFRSLKPLPCLGSYEQDMGTKYASMFLGFEQMVVQERTDGKCVCKGTTCLLFVQQESKAFEGELTTTTVDTESSSPFGLLFAICYLQE